jgi:predicted Zn-dependent protease
MYRFSRVCTIGVLLFISASAVAQSSACQAPVLKSPAPGANLFNDKQEMELAAVLHRELEQDTKMIEDEALTGELQRVGDRLSHSLPQMASSSTTT